MALFQSTACSGADPGSAGQPAETQRPRLPLRDPWFRNPETYLAVSQELTGGSGSFCRTRPGTILFVAEEPWSSPAISLKEIKVESHCSELQNRQVGRSRRGWFPLIRVDGGEGGVAVRPGVYPSDDEFGRRSRRLLSPRCCLGDRGSLVTADGPGCVTAETRASRQLPVSEKTHLNVSEQSRLPSRSLALSLAHLLLPPEAHVPAVQGGSRHGNISEQ